VDGLRAVAALWVVFFHIQAFSQAEFSHVPGLNLFLRSGSTGVSLFLVLSGFCLYIPFAGGRTGRFRTRQFLVRRCRRLMPAYYTSLALVLVLNLGVGVWLGLRPLSPTAALQQAAAHAALIHTLFPSTFYALNGAYWSLGLEWQLYISLPLLIWGIRRFGIRPTVLAVVACNLVYAIALALIVHRGLVTPNGLLATAILPNQLPGRWAEFAFGMVAAELYVTGRIRQAASAGPWLVPLVLALLLVASHIPMVREVADGAGRHIVYGSIFFVLLSLVLASNNMVSRLASWSPLVLLGTMSYSLYLVHQPLVAGIAYLAQAHAHTSPRATFLVLVALLPVVVFLAWVLFYTVERHTLTSGRQSQAPVATAKAAEAAQTA
jgi:peptidoglycan/LPS O-acetylase OafA/YrhL